MGILSGWLKRMEKLEVATGADGDLCTCADGAQNVVFMINEGDPSPPDTPAKLCEICKRPKQVHTFIVEICGKG